MLTKFRHLLSYNFIVIVALLLTACGSTPTPAKKVTPPPSWVYSILPNDTASKMYGLGIGKNREDAIKVALNDMVSRLNVTLKSSFKSKEKVTNYSQSSVVTSDIEASVSDIKISNYKVIKSYKLSYKEFAVMIETDKQKFVAGLKANLKNEKESITRRLESIATRDILTRYNMKKSLALEAKKLNTTVSIISILDKKFDAPKNRQFILSMEKEYLNESNKLKFFVHSDSQSVPFADKIKNFLAQEHFQISSKKQGSVLLSVKSKKNMNKSSVDIVVFTIDVSVFDAKTRIGGKNIIVKERYNGSMVSAYKSAAIHFEEDIKSQGINSVLGIDLDIE